MSKHNVVALSGREKIRDELTELIRDGAHPAVNGVVALAMNTWKISQP